MWIAFKLYKFDILKTTDEIFYTNMTALWIAFKLYKFDILKTTYLFIFAFTLRCELLSNFINLTYWKQPERNGREVKLSCELLSNFINLTYWKQLIRRSDDSHYCCELLSNFINLTYWKQLCLRFVATAFVVNCFQTL